jgi:hypothetical protein
MPRRLPQAEQQLDRLLDELGATPALGSTADLLAFAAALGPPDEARPYAVSEALEESREDRI